MNQLPNGAILPYGLLGVSEAPQIKAFQNAFNNKTLKAGIVVKRYSPKDPANLSGVLPEYDVMVIEGSDTPTTRFYKNCISAQSLGSIADYFEFQLRERTIQDKSNGGFDFDKQDGALVLILCLDGNEQKAIIISALKHPDRETKLSEDVLMAGAFNGNSVQVEKTGAFKYQFVGATDNQGKPLDESLEPTSFDVEKDGSVQIKHKTITQRMDKQGNYTLTSTKAQNFTSQDAISFNAGKDFSVIAKENLSVSAKDAIMKLQGSLTGECQTIKLQAGSEIDIKTATLNIKASGQAKIQSTNITLDGMTFIGGPGGLPILNLGTMIFGIGALAVPVVSYGIANFSKKGFAL